MLRRTAALLLPLLAVIVGLAGPASSAPSAPLALNLPGGTAFSILGHSCGGIREQVLASGFDPSSGFPTGAVYLQTRCGGSGRGGGYHVTTYSAWVQVTWDFTGAVVREATVTAEPPGLDPAFTATDTNGNVLTNQLNAINVTPAACAPSNTTYCSYSASLTWGAGFVPAPRLTAMSPTTGPASGGTSVTLTGTGFTGATGVSFGGLPAASFAILSDTSLTAISPAAGPGPVDVTVSSDGGTSTPLVGTQFDYVAAPLVTSVSPARGPVTGGTTVTIAGANFSAATAVTFGGVPAAFTVDGDGAITATAPTAEAADTVDVRVSSLGGDSPTSSQDVFTYVTPSASKVRCGKLSGTIDGAVTLAKCRPLSARYVTASAPSLYDSWTWSPSGATTVVTWSGMASPGQGGCSLGSVEMDVSGAVVDGTAAYPAIGDRVSARICEGPTGKVSLVPRTKFAL